MANNQSVTTTRILEIQVNYNKAVSDIAKYKKEIEELTAAQDRFRKAAKDQAMGDNESRMAIEAAAVAIRERKDMINALNRQVQNQIRTEREEEGSLKQLRAEISVLTKQYDEMSRVEREGAQGEALLQHINRLTTELKSAEEASQRYFRNVGNYSMVIQNGVVSTQELNRVLGLQASSIEGCIEQNRELEKAKLRLNQADASYARTIDAINKKIEENKRRIADVDAVLRKQATTVDEAQRQNKLLAEALKHVDLTSEGAKERIKQLNAKIEENNKLIAQNAPALMSQSEASASLADNMLNLVGLGGPFNGLIKSFGSSATANGNLLLGLGDKIKALGTSILGLLANPMVVAFLGIAGVGLGAKMWYDYNKGLVEATKLTEEFTGMAGDKMKDYRSEIKGVADTYGKDFKEVLQTADAMASNFGISFEEALQNIKDGFRAGADVNGDMLAKLEKYPAQFHEAGVSAQQFTALVAQTKSGIFGDKGLDAIKVATERIRRMPTATKDALISIGLSADAIQKGLEDGSLQTIDVVQQISEKLKGLPDTSQQVGDVLFNVFGKKGPDAGLEMIRSLADIDTNLESVKESTGELGALQNEQMESQIELEKTLSAIFDTTGGWFESMTTHAKTFVNKGLVAIITKVVELANWFIDLYNKSIVVRGGIAAIGLQFKNLWSILKAVFGYIWDSVAGLGTMIKGAFTLNWDEFKSGWDRAYKALARNMSDLVNDVIDNTVDAWNGLDNELNPIELKLKVDDSETMPAASAGAGVGGAANLDGKGKTSGQEKADEKAKKEAEKAEKERLRRQKLEMEAMNRLQSELWKIMVDGAEKRRQELESQYNKEIAKLKTQLATEAALTEDAKATINETIKVLEEQKQIALEKLQLAEIKRTYEAQQKINQIKLEGVIKGTEDEMAIRLENLKMQHEIALQEAEVAYEDEKMKQEALAELRAKYERDQEAIRIEYTTKAQADQRQAIEMMITQMQIAEEERLLRMDSFGERSEESDRERMDRQLASINKYEAERLRLAEMSAQTDYENLVERGRLETQSQQEYDNELLQAKQKWLESQKSINEAYVKNEQAKLASVKTVTTGLSGLLDQLGQDNKAFAKMSKIVALAQVAIDTGVAISEGLKASAGVPFPGNIAAIATTVGTVLANITTAISTIKAAKFAKGGKVLGPGTGTSDDIPAMLSNGEFVMTARATSVFEPLLVAMNNIGPSMPNMQLAATYDSVSANETLSEAFRQAVEEMPTPVVSVKEITDVADRIDVIEHLDNIR